MIQTTVTTAATIDYSPIPPSGMPWQEILRLQVHGCTQCPLHAKCEQPISGSGNPQAKIMFVGGRPDQWDDREGYSMVSQAPAGSEFNNLLGYIGLQRKDVWVSTLVKCAGPKNKTPTYFEGKFCADHWLERELEHIKPELVVAMSEAPARYFLGATKKLSDMAGLPYPVTRDWGTFTVIPVFHPASMLHSPQGAPLVYQSFDYVGRWVKGWRPAVDEVQTHYERMETVSDLEHAFLGIGQDDLISVDTESRPDPRKQKEKKPKKPRKSKKQPEVIEPELVAEVEEASIETELEEILEPPPEPPLGQLWCLTICYKPGLAFWVPNKPELMSWLAEHMPKYRVVFWNILYDLERLATVGIRFRDSKRLECGMQAAYVLCRSLIGLKRTAKELTGQEMVPFYEACPGGDPELLEVEARDKFIDYSTRDSDATLRSFPILLHELQSRPQLESVYRLDMDSMLLFLEMTQNGIPCNPEHLEALDIRLTHQVEEAVVLCRDLTGIPTFNPGSPKQVSDYLRPKIGSLIKKRTASGNMATGVKILERIQSWGDKVDPKLSKLVTSILSYRQTKKLSSTYVLPLIKHARLSPDSRVRGRINPARVTSGRSSMSEPNLQNVPIRAALGKEVRNSFHARPGWKLLSVDMSQSELRGLAFYARDPVFLYTFYTGGDPHRVTEMAVWGTVDEHRDEAKRTNFGIPYLISASGLRDQIGGTVEDAQVYLDTYFQSHPAVQHYMERVVLIARQTGWVRSLFGRRRFVPGINAMDETLREATRREIVNHDLQEYNAYVMKLGMREVLGELKAGNFRALPLLQVHDDLVFEVPDDEVERLGRMVKNLMESHQILTVPIKAEVKVGQRWGEQEKLKL